MYVSGVFTDVCCGTSSVITVQISRNLYFGCTSLQRPAGYHLEIPFHDSLIDDSDTYISIEHSAGNVDRAETAWISIMMPGMGHFF